MKNYNNLYVAFWASILSALFVLSLHQAMLNGDGKEYLLYTRALSAHFSPDLRKEDIKHIASILDKSEPDFRKNSDELGKGYTLSKDTQYDGKGFVRAQDGKTYSWHFWLYSAFVTPFFEITHVLEMPPAQAFVMCNWAFILATLSYLAFFWVASRLQKQVLASLFLLTGTTYYIWWTHPEVFTASLILLAFMLASDKRYGLAMLASALATTQNPPIIFLLTFFAVKSLLGDHPIRFKGFPFKTIIENNRRNFVVILVTFGIAILPVIFFHITLGVPNPIAAAGSTDMSLISLSRLFSLYFDLNLGMIVAAPGVFIGIASLIFLIILRSWKVERWASILGQIQPLMVGVLLSITMALPALATTNWNHGQSVFSRYAYWLAIPIIFGFVTSISNLSHRISIGLGVTVVAIQLATVSYFGVWGDNWRSDYTSFKPIANYLLQNHPELYNPIPEIFIERLEHHEAMSSIVEQQNQIFIYPEKGNPTKILLASNLAKLIHGNCQNTIVDRTEGDWSYISVLNAQEDCINKFLSKQTSIN